MNTMEKIKELKDNECIIDILRKETAIHPCNDCGKCVFGYEGILQLQRIFYDISEKKGKNTDIALLKDLCSQMKNQSLCEKGEEIGSAVLYAFEAYGADMEGHIRKKVCRTGVCSKFMTYHILPEHCVGCGDCEDACEDDAILGKKKYVHVIDQDECIQCGACMEACEEEAIVRAGAVKPVTPKKPVPCKK